MISKYMKIQFKGIETMKISDAKKRANDKYLKSLEELKVRVPKGDKQKIMDHAATQGESTVSFIRRAIAETMERDNQNK